MVTALALAPLAVAAGRVPAARAGDAEPNVSGAADPAVPVSVPEGTSLLRLEALRSGVAAFGGPELRYGAAAAGAVFRLHRNRPARLQLTNLVGEPTNLDLHGMRLPSGVAGIGGLAAKVLEPGGSAALDVTPPDSGTFWFHAGFVPNMADQTARGLAGALIVEEPDPPAVDRDLVLMLTDRAVGPPPRAVGGGSTPDVSASLLANGRTWPDEARVAPGSRVRLRLINASTRLALAVSCAGARPFVIAVDGQPSELFEPLRDTVPVGPGARFDLMLDLAAGPGATVEVLVSGMDAAAARAKPGSAALVLKPDGPALRARGPIGALPANPLLPRMIPLEASTRATLRAEASGDPGGGPSPTWRVNGASLAPGSLPKAPLFRARRNTPVTLGFRNAGSLLTAFRLHGHAMRLLHPLDDGWEPYWRDSILAAPGVTHHAAFLADNPGRWLIESSFADHAAAGLRTWFEVT